MTKFYDKTGNYLYTILENGKIISDVRTENLDFISSYDENNFSFFRVGNETTVRFTINGADFSVNILVNITDVIKAFNDIKKNIVRINENVDPNEKAKPSGIVFELTNDTINFVASGPNDKNKIKNIDGKINKNAFINFLKSIIIDYKNLVIFESFGNEVDSNKLDKEIKRLEKFIQKEI